MKDFISKATFSFLMGQLFPGAVSAFAVAFAYFTLETPQPDSMLSTAYNVLGSWGAATIPQQLFLVALCIGTGMFIHGLHWAALGAQEYTCGGAVYNCKWHHQPLWRQVLLGPWRVVAEVWHLFFGIDDVRHASVEENVHAIHKDLMPQFEFVEEFYLASGQFFMHTAYALMVCIGGIATFVVAHGFTWRRALLALAAYVLVGVFFLLGRIQLRSLFHAEEKLVSRSVWANVLAARD